MRIAFITFSLRGGGAERMVSRLSNAFVHKGYDVDLLLLYDAEEVSYDIEPAVCIKDCSYPKDGKVIKKIKQVRNIRAYIKQDRPDVIFCFILTTLPFAILANIGLGNFCKVIGTQRTNPKSIHRHYRIIVHPFLHLCDGFIFQTKGVQAYYPKWLQKKSVVIGNIAPQISGMERDEIRKDAVCSVGRLHEDKDYETLLKAFRKVMNAIPNATLHIYGDGPQKEKFVGLVQELDMSAHVVFEGFSKNVAWELTKYEVFAFSSKAEGMPNSLLEAMAAGLACVSSDCNFGPSDLIENGVNGFLVPVGDAEAMAEKLTDLLSNAKLRANIGKEAKKITIKYAEEKIVDQYMKYAVNLVRKTQ